MKAVLSFPGCHRKGGVERVMFECATFLAARGHDVDIVAEEWEPITGENVHFHRINVPARPAFLRGKRYFHAASEFLRDFPGDVLNTHGSVCPVGGVQWVQSIHAAWLDRAKTMRRPLSAARIKQLLNPVHPILLKLEAEHFRKRQYKTLIATTSQVVADLTHYYGVPAEDVEIIPNGFNPQEFNPERRAARRAEARKLLGLNDDQIALLFVANELQRKGFFVLLDALKKLNDPRIRLLAIGRPAKSEVMAGARAAGRESQVLALGPATDVAGMHAASDLFVLPTQYEAFSLAILESLGSGLPVITTSVPGACDAIQEGINGRIMRDPLRAEELAAILGPLLDHDKIAALARTTAPTVASYQWPDILKRYEAVLERHRTK